MSSRACILADMIPVFASGQFWAYLNWALGLCRNGFDVIWLCGVHPDRLNESRTSIAALDADLRYYGFGGRLALYSKSDGALPAAIQRSYRSLDEAAEADVLLNFHYDARSNVVARFRRSVLIDIDPGLLQIWVHEGGIQMARHSAFFTIGERVEGGPKWRPTHPCVALDHWPKRSSTLDAPFTTVSCWWGNEWVQSAGEVYCNDKRTGFSAFLDLPGRTQQNLELALCLAPGDDDEREALRRKGWRVREASTAAATPWDYHRYIQTSRGEFSCAKPSCVRLQNAWISDRTVCYLASGKPAVVQHTGPSSFLPDCAGLFRFRDIDEAARSLQIAATDYDHQCELARELAEEYFDAAKVVRNLLEQSL